MILHLDPATLESVRVGRHFSLAEMLRSETAARAGISNLPTEQRILDNLMALCAHILDPLRDALGPVNVISGYRTEVVNAMVGGSRTSQHMDGEAADLSVSGHTLDDVFLWIRGNAPYDQVLREFPPGGWVHVSYGPRNRRQALLATKRDGQTVYEAVV